MGRILVLHGPNLNLLGTREPHIYGTKTLGEIDRALEELGGAFGHDVECFQSNHEGALVDRLQGCPGVHDAVLLNAAAYTHTSVAIRDALSAIRSEVVIIEVHLSIPEAREPFRHVSLVAPVVHGRIEGLGDLSYLLALRAASALIAARGDPRDQ